MAGSKYFSFFFLGVTVVVLAGLLYLGSFVGNIFRPASVEPETISFVIEPGDSLNKISDTLAQTGLINSRWTFKAYVRLRGWSTNLQAGEYMLAQNLNIRELTYILVTGRDATPEEIITIIEGWTMDDIANYLETEGLVSRDDFFAAAERLANHASITALADKPSNASLEGYLFPDSYRIFKGATAEEIILKMLNTLDNKLTIELRDAIEDRGQSIFETIVMASILEKEIKNPEDLAVASDVFYKRLKVGQALQSDATLNYILPARSKKDRLNNIDLQNPSPYNTYKYQGLPPGPISNPGFKAIYAAIFPEANDYWYFLTDQNGNTRFAKTYAGHLENRRKYLD